MNNKQTQFISINRIEPNPNQPRKFFNEQTLTDLAENIRANGLLNPVTVRPYKNSFQIVQGERRYRAAKLIGLEEIEAKVIDADDKKSFILALIENIQRDDLNCIEEMVAYLELQKQGLTQQQIAETINKTQSYVAQKIRLDTLPITVNTELKYGFLTESGARQLLKIGGIISKYQCKPFIEFWGYKHPVYQDWTSYFQSGIGERCIKQSVLRIEEEVDLLRFNFFHAYITNMPTEEEKESWIGSRSFPFHKLLKVVANPVLLKDEMEEICWGFQYDNKFNPQPYSEEEFMSRDINQSISDYQKGGDTTA